MKNFILFFLILMVNGLFAQSPQFSIYVGPNYSLYSAENSMIEGQRAIRFDTSGVTTVNILNEVEYQFTNQPGANIHGQVHFKINEEIGLVTGLQFAWSGFKIESNNLGFMDHPNTDTTFFPSITNPIGNTSNCVFTESFPSTDPDRRIDHQMIYLSIPLNVEFKLGDPISIQAGGFMSTPIYTRVSEERLILVNSEPMIIDGQETTICSFELTNSVTTTGDNFNNLLFGINLSANYRITKNLELSMYFSKNLNRIYAINDDVNFVRNHLRAKVNVYQASIGVRYLFGTQPEDSNQ